jgi:hypothetical protein
LRRAVSSAAQSGSDQPKSKEAIVAKASGGSGKSKGGGAKRGSGKRELINTGTDKRFVRRGTGGQFKESDDVGKSLSADRRKKAKTVSKAGQGDRGDRKR